MNMNQVMDNFSKTRGDYKYQRVESDNFFKQQIDLLVNAADDEISDDPGWIAQDRKDILKKLIENALEMKSYF